MTEVSVTELARGLSDFINRATYRHEEFLIIRGGKPVAALSPVPTGSRVSDLETVLSELPSLAIDDLSAFDSDVAGARDHLNDDVTDPWQS
ncbi:MAG: antitoxin (DNA-binding transcriptional repressor) of toxin-antitoxin stability system [Verrucomicrobiales bacterium]|jgi:antitoxin (DNA-binding transcriptional repressor) of toxin-antitoxin stability system